MPNSDDPFSQILTSDSKHICLIAAPGSGKTSRALIPKVKQVLTRPGVDSKDVLILSFSRMSAADLKKRIGQTGARASTVHSFCLSLLLSEDNHQIRKRINSIILDFERDTLIADLKVLFPTIKKTTLKKQLDRFAAGWAIHPHDEVFEEDEEQRSFKQAVMNWLDEHQAAMMEEIVYYAVDLAEKVSDLKLVEEPKYIFVDEYQDLNVLEQKFVELLADHSELLLVVGDPDQSIYSFKYAHPQGIEIFADQRHVEKHSSLKTGRCGKRIVNFARHLLKQSDPTRTELLEALASNEDGEVHFVRKTTQDDEFAYVLKEIALKLQNNVSSKDTIVLVPKKKLGQEFEAYAEKNKGSVGITSTMGIFKFTLKPEFTDEEQNRILLFALVAKPSSILHFRCQVGVGDETAFSKEIRELKSYYGSLEQVLTKANADDFPNKKIRLKALCERITRLRAFLDAHKTSELTEELLDEIFPSTDPAIVQLRIVIDKLREDQDTPSSLYEKFTDYVRTIPDEPNTIRIMTLMASKGLEADHVFIMGCNDGNIPGQNRSTSLSDVEHKEEQRRLLYVGFTRAKKSLTVSWSRYIPFHQSKGHFTASVGTIKIGGKTFSKLGISPFLQDLPGVTWET